MKKKKREKSVTMNKKREAKESYMTRFCTFTMRSLACVGWPVYHISDLTRGKCF